ncbi:MAG: zinc ABC transporter substrate-binding protein [Nocardiopsaceae bacterium]|jgi:zinc/manganese transport system substrate-binding protein|nr:zinc ABC transporter substrate-binding protein [Nocardiopsaceae bacterium]
MAIMGMNRPGLRMAAPVVVSMLTLGSLVASGCSTAGAQAAANPRVVRVTAAENFWGSIAMQLGGSHAHVTSIIANPNTDPHSYEPTAADARAVASARLVIENGVGYDPWMSRLLAANSGEHISVLNVGEAVGAPADGNPHRWYNPADVRTVIGKLTADLSRADPADRAYFARREARLLNVGLRQYHALIATIRARYAGTPVGASESIFAMLAPALGLRLITPASFLKAITEGTEVSAADKRTIDAQISEHKIKIYVYNSQNVTPDVQAQLAAARAAHIPVASITETMTPPAASYQQWQVRQLRAIAAALATAEGHKT